ncbi:SulP family inorganic anion transporter [Patulibacter sp. NPDC049589]|uniref:SulP family inorganic anion transporter n=1 Tax=Patulibacter sp. NPDC049589 TaxID=3154731 RepID=UPI0034186D16
MTRPDTGATTAAAVVGARLRTLAPRTSDYAGLRDRGWVGDLIAGVTVAVVALPLALAFGAASGVGATAGLVTAVVAGTLAAVFGGSSVQVSGPTGAMTVVLVPLVATHGAGVVPAVALLAGVFVVLAGVLGLGRLVAFIPWPVVEGFTFGIAVVIAAQQVPSALGVDKPDGENAALVAARAIGRFAERPDLGVIALLVVAAGLTALLPRLHRALPSSLVAIVVATVLAGVLGIDVARIGALPSSLPTPALPDLDGLGALVVPALVVAALAALESLLSAEVADGMSDRGRHDPDRELVGQGIANVGSAFFGGLPATGALARTAVNVRSGARTRAAAIVHALVLLGLMAAASGVVGRIPLVALAGVLLVTAWRMVERRTVSAVLRSTRTDAAIFVLTAGATVVFDLVTAVELGIAVAVLVAVVKLAGTAQAVREEPDFGVGDAEERELLRRHVLVYRLDGPLFFAVAARFLKELTATTDVRVVVLRLGNLAMLDATGARALGAIVEELHDRGIEVLLKVADPAHVGLLRSVGALDEVERTGHVFAELEPALELARLLARRPDPAAPAAGTTAGPVAV